jgi:aminopeptidase N|tara:strand:+ start:28 stop:249 length:222 start_codon:yes stop_codon:yes gene_type:complete
MSRIVYQDGKLLLSLTKNEIKQAQENIGRPIELPIGQLKVFHEDISKAVMQHWSKVEVYEAIKQHRLENDNDS